MTEQLTEKEKECVYLVSEGLPTKVIATKMNRTEHSVRDYIKKIQNKTGLRRTAFWKLR